METCQDCRSWMFYPIITGVDYERMTSLDFDQDSFYICTETSPRCFVVQKAIQVDRSQIERVKKDLDKGETPASNVATPPAPPMPHWFDEECRRELMMASDGGASQTPHCTDLRVPLTYDMVVGHLSGPPAAPRLQNVKTQVKAQLEYYFSRENLATDRYLRCQMDTDNFVPISIIAGFRKIVQLTNDYALIVQTLRESSQVEVDERGERVRPVNKRCTIIIREMDEGQAEEVRELLSGGPSLMSLTYGLQNSWYVTYASEELTQQAYLHLQKQDKRICARIKSGAPPDMTLFVPPPIDETLIPTQSGGIFDLGKVLASLGFVPRATYRPGTTLVQVMEGNGGNESGEWRQDGYDNGRRRGGMRGGRGGREYNQRNRHTSHSKNERNGGRREEGKETMHIPCIQFNYQEESFPSLVEEEPIVEKKRERLSFSCVAAGRKEEKKKSYAQSLVSK